jgi:uncharacterized repeat protein (TIGR03806 family)
VCAVFLGMAIAALAACGGGSGSGEPVLERVAPALNFPGATVQIGDVRFDRAYPDLSFPTAVLVRGAPGDSTNLYVAQQNGVIRTFDASDPAASVSTLFLDLTDRTRANGEQGLLGFVFDPDYASNGFVYVHYNQNANPDVGAGDTVVSRFQANPVTRSADPTTTVELFRFPQPFSNHNGGSIEFGPDGKLYIALGDGGSGNDPGQRAQDLSNPLGKVLRINSDGTVPEDNPFFAMGGQSTRIWALGLRNPFRISFDGDNLWAGDVGQSAREEIDLIVRGGNYGWRKFEGTRLNFAGDAAIPDAIPPVYEYGRSLGVSITGGRVYRGAAIPALVGSYVYGDFGSGRIWALTERDGRATSNLQLGTVTNPSSFGADLNGELLITSYGGGLFRAAPNDGGSAGVFPQRLSDTGLFSDLATLRPAPGVVPYVPNAPFWSDGTRKQRWIAVPGTTAPIGFSADQNWTFPVGTVTVKHFEITLADQRTVKRLETRIFVHTEDQDWQGYTYRWNEAGTDALLLVGNEAERTELSVADGSGGTRNQTYEFPSRNQCLTCHTEASGRVLGVRTNQLNDGASGNQLTALNAAGYFDRDIGAASQYDALPNPLGTADLALRARAYLETNCSQCHQPGGPTPVNMDLRAATPIAETNTVGVTGNGAPVGGATVRIVAGDMDTSLVWTRMNTRAEGEAMPPLSSHVIDAQGLDLIGDWIDAGAN